ncbi:SusC/RagA family TonB-linked outer membrane protein [Flavobacterium sp. RS13.1]|uniref:SusC/RagA family TonB-linked outer membrane protein n=1 Tax=Flavobacterium sp. RS13.1 TaxID=3400345 RepID=UPI003AAE4D64
MNFKKLLNIKANCYLAIVLLLCLLTTNKASAQDLTVEGVVKDASGLTLPGVNVSEKGSKNGVSTDFDGKYKLKVSSSKAILEFSFIGFTTQAVTVAGKSKINIILKEEANTLNEVVVVGYGTVKKSDLTGAVATLSGSDLRKTPVASVAEALTGRLAGVNVTSSEGSPDSEIKIRVRGGGSLTQDASPLYIVDGFPVNSLRDISSSDIENMTVLKDASSTAIYGSRGSNGVIIVTTKKGKDGKIQVNFNSFFGMKKLAKEIDVLSPEDFVNWQYEYALLEKGNTESYEKYFGNWQDRDLYSGIKGNNWQKQIYGRTGEVKSYDLGIRGGSDKINYNFNYARYDEKAIMVGSDFKRNNLALALNNKTSDKIDLSFTMRYSDTEIEGGGANEQSENPTDSRLRHSVGYAPIPMPGLTTDDPDESDSSYLVYPFVAVADTDRLQKRKNFNMLGSFSWKIIENLQFKTDLGLDNYSYLDYRFYGRSTYYARTNPSVENIGKPSLLTTDRKDTRFRNANTLNYDFKKILGKNHDLKVLVGEEMIDYRRNDVGSTIEGYPNFFDLDQSIRLTSQGKPRIVDNFYFPDDKLLSFFGRVNYDYKDRYLFTATYRADGSSKFLGDNKWGFFPAAAVAWKISEESFLKDLSWLNSLKVRLSYGQAGNNNIPTGQTVQSYAAGNSTWINGQGNYWAPSVVLANPDLKWETTVTQNLGLDFDFFKGRINGSLEAYKNLTKDLLVNFPVTGTGYTSQYRNMGEVQNTGFEATLNVVALEKKDYGLNFSFNIGVNKNRINSLGTMSNFEARTDWASTAIGTDYLVQVGSPIGLMYGYKNDGRYEVSDFDYASGQYTLKSGVANASELVGTIQPGKMKLKDLNNDGVVDETDRTVIGDANPDFTGGFVLNANAYGFDLSASFNFSVGNDVYNANKIEYTTAGANGQYRNLGAEMAAGNRWTNIDPVSGQLVTDPTALTELNANTNMWSPNMKSYVFSDWAVEDGSFLRLNTLTLGYTAPTALISKLGVSKLRFYFTGTNVFILTNYSGQDPEVSTRRATPLTPGVDYSAYPRSRQLIFGLNLNF